MDVLSPLVSSAPNPIDGRRGSHNEYWSFRRVIELVR